MPHQLCASFPPVTRHATCAPTQASRQYQMCSPRLRGVWGGPGRWGPCRHLPMQEASHPCSCCHDPQLRMPYRRRPSVPREVQQPSRRGPLARPPRWPLKAASAQQQCRQRHSKPACLMATLQRAPGGRQRKLRPQHPPLRPALQQRQERPLPRRCQRSTRQRQLQRALQPGQEGTKGGGAASRESSPQKVCGCKGAGVSLRVRRCGGDGGGGGGVRAGSSGAHVHACMFARTFGYEYGCRLSLA